MDVLADSGILLRLVDPGALLRPVIRSKIRDLVAGGDRVITSHQNYSEFWNVCTRPKSARGGLGLSIAEADRRMTILESSFGRLMDHPDAFPIWRTLIIKHRVQGKQVHDARLVALMMAHGITHIMTLNAADFARYPQITVIDPSSP